jgi:MFS family permease
MLVGSLAVCSFAFQQNVMNPVLPALDREFHASTTWATWLITAFLMVGATTSPLLGRVGDQFGRKAPLLGSLAVFTVASAVAAAAPSLWVLIVCRAACGVSGAFVPLCFALVTQHVRHERVGRGVGSVARGIGIGAILGVTLGPIVTDALSWRWTFVISAVMGATAFVVSARVVPVEAAARRGRIDGLGAMALALAIGMVMLGLTEGNRWGWTSPSVLLLLAGGATAVALWLVVEQRVEDPMVDVRILSQSGVLATASATFLGGMFVFTWAMLVPRMVAEPRGEPAEVAPLLHYGFGADSTAAGLFLLPASIGSFLLGVMLGRLAGPRGWRLTFILYFVGFIVSASGLAFSHGAAWQIYVFVALGSALGPFTSVASKLMSEHVPRADHAVVTALMTVTFYVGGVLGAQVAAAVLASHRVGGTQAPSSGAFEASFLLCAVAAALALPFCLLAAPRSMGR